MKGNQEKTEGERLPNQALQRIAARWRIGTKPKGHVWAARAEGGR
jgi:hypothetical protein